VRGEEGRVRAARIVEALGALFHGARVPVIVLQPDGSFVAANAAAILQYGYSLDELLELKVHDLIIDDRDVDRDLRLAAAGATSLDRRRHRRKDGEREPTTADCA